MLRSVFGVLVGTVLWMLGFYALAIVLANLWPDYATHGRQWARAGTFTFTPLMAVCNLAFWALAEFGAGWIAATISRRPGAVWILAALLGIYLAVIHLFLYWPRFPWWYNLGVVIPSVPAILLGALLANNSSAERAQSSHA